MVRRNIADAVAMKLAGHETRSVFDRYNVVSDSDLRTAAIQLGTLEEALISVGLPGRVWSAFALRATADSLRLQS